MRTTNKSSESKKKEGRLSGLMALAIPATAVLLAVLLNCLVMIIAVVPSASMEDTVKKDSVIFANRLAYLRSSPERGDIILFKKRELTGNLLVKRIVAMPGETVYIELGRVYVNGELLEEPYVREFSKDSMGALTVPEGCYFVLGDNRNNSTDARFWDDPFVNMKDIKAKAVLTLYPKWGSLY